VVLIKPQAVVTSERVTDGPRSLNEFSLDFSLVEAALAIHSSMYEYD
jgi:hypothetical protein